MKKSTSPYLKIELLNHASVIVHFENLSFLTDPWLTGTCFHGGWGLKYANDSAIERAASCSHLWVSHPHSDHLHPLTLKKIQQKNPAIKILANRSFNYDLSTDFEKLGFNNISPIEERKKLQLTKRCSLLRVPASGIDNMLLMDLGGFRILNYNDCNLPKESLKLLFNKIGAPHILLLGFNHAGMLHNLPNDKNTIFSMMRKRVRTNIEALQPKWVIPFASWHHYRSPYSTDFNQSMLEPADLTNYVPNLIPLRVGERVEFQRARDPIVSKVSSSVDRAIDTKRSGNPVDFPKQRQAAEKYVRTLKKEFFGITRLLPKISIWLDDLDYSIELDIKGAKKSELTREQATFVTTSYSLYRWFEGPFGTDTFLVGSDFFPVTDKKEYNYWFLTGLLIDNKLSFLSLLKMFFTLKGLKFLWNRREELLIILFKLPTKTLAGDSRI